MRIAGTDLDGMTHLERVDVLARLSRAEQRALYERAIEAPPLGLDFFVPADTPRGAPVQHVGANTLPVPRTLRRFRKPFMRPEDDAQRLYGYNDWALRKVCGPGYFVARVAEDGVVLDYSQVPEGGVPPGWPAIVPNSRGLQRLLVDGTRDLMRRVSEHVSVGAVFKGQDALDHYFVLCRDPA